MEMDMEMQILRESAQRKNWNTGRVVSVMLVVASLFISNLRGGFLEMSIKRSPVLSLLPGS